MDWQGEKVSSINESVMGCRWDSTGLGERGSKREY